MRKIMCRYWIIIKITTQKKISCKFYMDGQMMNMYILNHANSCFIIKC
jgi:hypothetical protein